VDLRGNDVRYVDILQPHERLVVSAASLVLTAPALVDDQRELSPLERVDYLGPTRYVPRTEAVRGLAAPCLASGDANATACAVLRAVKGALTYTKGITDVTTTAEEALTLGRGVCQDYAHLMLAACRCLGLPARYVSGYLYDPKPGSEAAPHAWVDVFLDGRGWLSLDPTHGVEQTERHIRVAVGRDYGEVTPTRGVYTGNATETLAIAVTVSPA
jgi:transglutaminase-like putative cysteine protease